MLFGLIYTPHDRSEASQKRSLQLFTNWAPPVEFKGHWALASGGGMGPIAPFTPFFDFEVEPVISIEEGVPIYMKTNAWRDSVA
jgi:hypothetical protein